VVVVLHHLAPHRNRISATDSSRRLQSQADGGGGAAAATAAAALVQRYRAVVDLVYWQNRIYECDANTQGVEELKELLKEPEEEEFQDRQLATPQSGASNASATPPVSSS
jgi:hypothetical protein